MDVLWVFETPSLQYFSILLSLLLANQVGTFALIYWWSPIPHPSDKDCHRWCREFCFRCFLDSWNLCGREHIIFLSFWRSPSFCWTLSKMDFYGINWSKCNIRNLIVLVVVICFEPGSVHGFCHEMQVVHLGSKLNGRKSNLFGLGCQLESTNNNLSSSTATSRLFSTSSSRFACYTLEYFINIPLSEILWGST